MHLSVRCACVAVLVGFVAAACSSDKPGGGTADSGSGGDGAATGTGGGKAVGGGFASGGDTSAAMCDADAGSSGCRKCLAQTCCDDYKACLDDKLCSKSLTTQIGCYGAPGSETSDCFGAFSRALQGDAGQAAGLAPIPICIIKNCSMACGGPGVV
jgi:hypothetical protein